MKALLRLSTASALVLTATLAGAGFAQDTTATGTPAAAAPAAPSETQTTTTSSTTTTPTATKTKSKTKARTTTPAPAADAATTVPDAAATSAAAPTADAATATAAPATSDAAAAPAAGGTVAAPAADGTTAAAAPAASANPTVGGAAMDAAKTIVDNASAAPNLSTLVSAVKAADLATTLAGTGPFTVFAPTNDAFGRLAPGTLETLMKPAGKATLVKVLKYHVVAGTLTIADLKAKVAAGGGTATLTTVEGQPLTVKVNKTAAGEALELTSVSGNKSYIETGDVRQSNGIVHVVNGVVIPKLN